MWRLLLHQDVECLRHELNGNLPPAEAEAVRARLADAAARMNHLNLVSTCRLGRVIPGLSVVAERSIIKVMELLGAQYGTLQVIDPEAGGLVIVAQRNLTTEYLEHFAVVPLEESPLCAHCLTTGSVVLAEVDEQPASANPGKLVAEAAGVSAVLCIPLRTPSGKAIGVLSPQFDRLPHLRAEDIEAALAQARIVAEQLDRMLATRTPAMGDHARKAGSGTDARRA